MESKDSREVTNKEKKSLKNNNTETSRISAESSMVSSSSTSSTEALNQQPINSHQLSIRSSRKQQIITNVMKHIDSPRPLQPSNLQNQKLSSSINTPPRTQNYSSSVIKDKKKPHARRLSYDGRESRESKLSELPRLSLDSKRGRIKSASASASEFKSEFSQQEEPGSSRPVSSIVAKLMGLDDLPQQTRSRRSEDLDLLSRSTRSTEESDTESERHSVSIYREIDKRLGELDFRKSSKDLRALKHILEAMQRTKSKMEGGCNDNLEQWNGQKGDDQGIIKPGKVSRKEEPKMPSNLPRVRTGQAARRAKDLPPKTQQKCGKFEKFSQERRAVMTSNQEPKNLTTKQKAKSSRQTIETRTRKVVDQCDMVHTPRPSQKLHKTMGHGANVVNEEPMTVVKEQPSPVSVLDADFYGDESPSPIKKKATVFQDDDSSEWIATDASTRSSFSSYNMGKTKETPNDFWLGSPVQPKGSYRSIEDENELFLTSIIATDLGRRSESWTDFSSENSWLVLDIERLLFKDLIVELLHGEASW